MSELACRIGGDDPDEHVWEEGWGPGDSCICGAARALLPRDPSIRDVLDKLEEMNQRLISIEQQFDNGVCGYGAYD